MKQFIYGLAVVALLATSCKKEAPKGEEAKEVAENTDATNQTSYGLDSANSVVNWRGYKISDGKEDGHYGTIRFNANGEFTANGDQLTGGTFEAGMSSLVVTDIDENNGKSKLEAHLMDGDFFDASKYPVAKFEITNVAPISEGDYNTEIEGNFTIKAVTKSYKVKANTSMTDSTYTINTAEFDIDRQQFGIIYKSTLKDTVVKDNIQLQITITGNKK